MRGIAGIVLGLTLSAPAFAGEIGLPSDGFVTKWTALPTGRFVVTAAPTAPVRTYASTPIVEDVGVDRAVHEAIASAADGQDRGDIALYEMATNWDQPQRTALEALRERQRAYAAAAPDGARAATFVATLARVVDGTGRSSATDGTATDAALDGAYKAALAVTDDAGRAKLDAAQTAWCAYRDAFIAFADAQAPGMAAPVKDELTHRRIADLTAQ